MEKKRQKGPTALKIKSSIAEEHHKQETHDNNTNQEIFVNSIDLSVLSSSVMDIQNIITQMEPCEKQPVNFEDLFVNSVNTSSPLLDIDIEMHLSNLDELPTTSQEIYVDSEAKQFKCRYWDDETIFTMNNEQCPLKYF